MGNNSVVRMEMQRFRESVKARTKLFGAVDLLTVEME
jgi:hypothetical protein